MGRYDHAALTKHRYDHVEAESVNIYKFVFYDP